MQRMFATQYVIAGESYGFPGDALVCDDEARAATSAQWDCCPISLLTPLSPA
jgi:hypothetical protein